MIIDHEELQEWVQRWFTADSEEEFEALKRIFEASGAKYEEFKSRLMLLGFWRDDMKMLQPDTQKKIDLF